MVAASHGGYILVMKPLRLLAGALFGLVLALPPARGLDSPLPADVASALERSGDNRPQLLAALEKAPAAERSALEFLVANLPDRDLKELSSDFLLENSRYAHAVLDEVSWGKRIPRDIFLDGILPHASINERRDPWRRDFHDRFLPWVKDARGPGHAAAILNQRLFAEVKVRYSTGRPKADQSPYESMKAGLASCTGLAILLIDACRAVGVPARFVGTPLWADRSGNHSWVEVWDDGWHFTGAAEPSGDRLDQAWFIPRASQAVEDDPRHAIYAVSFRRTPLRFPLVWDRSIDYVHAVNVTSRYTSLGKPLAPGEGRLGLRVLDRRGGRRVAARVRIALEDGGRELFAGSSRDERFDANDHLSVALPLLKAVRITVHGPGRRIERAARLEKSEELITLALEEDGVASSAADDAAAADAPLLSSPAGKRLVARLEDYFRAAPDARDAIAFEPELDELLASNAGAVRRAAWRAHAASHARTRLAEDFDAHRVTFEKMTMPYVVKPVGSRPSGGWPLFIAMHGGGGVPKRVNDSQWQHMQIYYRDQKDVEGYLYLAPRAPNDVWNGFYDWYNLRLTENLIRQMVLLGDVDPDRIFIMGYSHGGYGAFHIGLNMADRFAAIHASAAAPTEGNRPGRNLRNTPFTFMIGERDTMYERLDRCRSFDAFLGDLKASSPGAYPVAMELKLGYPHSGLPDRDKIRELYAHVRNAAPRHVTWAVGGTTERFHWLHVPRPKGGHIDARIDGNTVTLRSGGIAALEVYLDERLVDLTRPVTIDANGQRTEHRPKPSLRTLCETLEERGDPRLAFTARVRVEPPPRRVRL